MSYTAPQYVDTKEQAILALASTIKGEAVTGGDGSVNRALDVLADVLAEQDVQVPQTDAGAILALAQYASGMVKPEGTIAITENGEGIDVAQYATADVSVSGGGGSSDFTTAEVTIVNNTGGDAHFNVPIVSAEYRMSGPEFGTGDASATVTAAMYMGTAFATFNDAAFSVSATGDAEIDAPSIFITGDCTLTFTLAN